MKNILITGGCGFIMGHYIRDAIYAQGEMIRNAKQDGKKIPDHQLYKFISIDRVSNNASSAMYVNRNHTFYPADLCDNHITDTIFGFEKPDIVIHGAASTFVDTSIVNPSLFVNDNVLATQNVINACVKHNVKRLIYCSTDEVMGQLGENDSSWTEKSPLNPRNPYASTKAAGELLIKAAYETYGLNYNITRSSNNYGPRQLPEKLIPKTIRCILNNEKIPIYGQGKQIRDWTYVKDNCAALQTILELGKPNEIYNVSANQEFSNLEVIHEICKYLGKGHDLIEFVPDPRGGGHDFRYSVNSDKLRSLGWKPETNFKRDLGTNCIEWYVMNQSMWFKH
jgi:dTDP-glucose 4,6-dehydratase